MYFQAFDDKKDCRGYYYDKSVIYGDLPPDLTRTWSNALSVSGREIECADLYCGKKIDDVCPDDLKNDWGLVSGRLKAFLRSFILSKIDLSENCFYDLVPERFLLNYYDVKNEITKRVLKSTKQFCNGKVVSILEGGYDLNALAESANEHVNALLEFN